jgi:hypothetical protein
MGHKLWAMLNFNLSKNDGSYTNVTKETLGVHWQFYTALTQNFCLVAYGKNCHFQHRKLYMILTDEKVKVIPVRTVKEYGAVAV